MSRYCKISKLNKKGSDGSVRRYNQQLFENNGHDFVYLDASTSFDMSEKEIIEGREGMSVTEFENWFNSNIKSKL